MFQSTRPRGARLFDLLGEFTNYGFNPRAHAGRDLILTHINNYLICFNPRAHAGRDLFRPRRSSSARSFNPRAHAGRDTCGILSPIAKASFNPRAHAGRDIPTESHPPLSPVSIHAPTRGAT